jgi:hypothetical protein
MAVLGAGELVRYDPDLGEVVLEVTDVVAHEIIECRGLVSRNGVHASWSRLWRARGRSRSSLGTNSMTRAMCRLKLLHNAIRSSQGASRYFCTDTHASCSYPEKTRSS